jgi:hypothetical protein
MTDYPYNLSITTSVSNRYGELMRGLTERVAIIGFADCDSSLLNLPYLVHDIGDALSTFTGSGGVAGSLQRGLLECYYAGCRDIILIPIGTMSEFTAFESGPDALFYGSLDLKYQAILNVLRELDFIDMIVPYDANPLVDTSMTIFGNWVNQVYENNLTQIILPLPTGATGSDFSSISNPHISLVAGQGIFDFSEINSHKGNLASTFAGFCSCLAPNVPPDNRTISTIHRLTTDYEGYESTLETNRIIGARKTTSYNRGYGPYVSFTLCRTLAATTSDFTSYHTIRTIRRLMRDIYSLDIVGGKVLAGQEQLEQLFDQWISNGYVSALSVAYDHSIPEELGLNMTLGILSPYEQINISANIGPLSA